MISYYRFDTIKKEYVLPYLLSEDETISENAAEIVVNLKIASKNPFAANPLVQKPK